MAEAGLQAISQRRHPGLAPFLMTEGVAAEPVPVIPPPHFHIPLGVPSDRARA
jgi:hypothetical protein